MPRYNLAEAKAHLSALVDRAVAGEEIEIGKRGAGKVRLVPIEPPDQPIDVGAMRALTDNMEDFGTSGADFIREMRDDYRY